MQASLSEKKIVESCNKYINWWHSAFKQHNTPDIACKKRHSFAVFFFIKNERAVDYDQWWSTGGESMSLPFLSMFAEATSAAQEARPVRFYYYNGGGGGLPAWAVVIDAGILLDQRAVGGRLQGGQPAREDQAALTSSAMLSRVHIWYSSFCNSAMYNLNDARSKQQWPVLQRHNHGRWTIFMVLTKQKDEYQVKYTFFY
jgi:hypothetical protein